MVIRFRLIAVLIAGLATSSCTSGHQEFYRSQSSPLALAKPMPHSGPAEVVQGSGDIEADRQRYHQDGYVLIGYSSFSGPREAADGAAQQAKKVGAAIVAISSNYERTARGLTPVTTVTPTTTYTSGSVSGYGSGGPIGGSYLGSSTSYSQQTTQIPYSVDRYQQTALYFARAERKGIGILASEIPPSQRQQIGTNRGILVNATRKGSPAWGADILAGDVVLAIGGSPVFDQESYGNAVVKALGSETLIEIARSGATHRKAVRIPVGEW